MYYVTRVYEFIAMGTQLAGLVFNDITDIFIFILQIIFYVRIDGCLLLLRLLVGGRREVLCPERLHPRDPLQHLLLATAVLRVGVTLLLLHVTNELNEVLEVIGAKLGEQGTFLLELDIGQVSLSIKHKGYCILLVFLLFTLPHDILS